MIKHFSSFEEIDIPKDENGNYIVDDPDIFDSTYDVHVLDRSHSNGSKIAKQKKVFVNLMVYSFKCKKCGKPQTRSFRWAHIDAHKTLLCQDCLNIARYGYAHTYDNPEKQKYALGRIVEEHGGYTLSKGSDIRESTLDEIEKRYGHRCSLKNEAVLQKSKDKNLAKLGVEFPLQNKAIQEITRDRYQEKTGFRFPLQNPEAKEKQKQNNILKFGVDNPMKVPEIQEKNRKTKFERYGDENYNNHPKAVSTKINLYGRVFNNTKLQYFDGEKFDSRWELALWIYAKDHNIPIQKYSGDGFKYSVNGVEHAYYPDFIYNGEIVEVKGDHFVNDQGVLINPFSDDNKQQERFKIKQEIALKNGIKFLYYEDMIPILQYVEERYGKSYLKLWGMTKDSFPFNREILTNDPGDTSLINKFHKSIYYGKTKGCKYSPYEAWFDKVFVKAICDNREKYSNYSDPLSPRSIVYGFSATYRAKKVSVFNPSLAKELVSKYLSDASVVFDPFSGFSGRMLGCIRNNIPYIGQDVNSDHVYESIQIIKYLLGCGKNFIANVSVKNIFNDFGGEYDCLFTCPPYEDKEDWGNENQEILSCDEWIDECLKRYKCRKYLFVVDKTCKYSDKIVQTIENKNHLNKHGDYNSKEYVILINNEVYTNPKVFNQTFIMPLQYNYFAYVQNMIWNSYRANNGIGITPFDKFDDKGYAIHSDDEIGVTPFDLD